MAGFAAASVAAVVLPLLFGGGALVMAIALVGFAFALRSPNYAVSLAVGVGLSAGFLRRVIDFVFPESIGVDLLVLLPGALVLATLALHWRAGRATGRVLPSHVKWIAAALLVGTVNPFGAGLAANLLTGSLIGIALAGYLLVARGLVDLRPILTTATLIGVVSSIFMLFQEAHGLLPWDRNWVDADGYAALYLAPGVVRPLGLSSSAAESAALCAIALGLLVWRVRESGGIRRVAFATVSVVPAVALLSSGTRTYLITGLVAATLALVSGRRRPLLALLLTVIPAAALLSILASRLLPTAGAGAARTLTTLSGGEDLETSTIPLHLDLLTEGVRTGLSSVVGSGAGQLGVLAGNGGNAEIDFANAALMSGVIGFIAICVLYVVVLRRGLLCLRLGRSGGVAALIVAIGAAGQWLSPGYYGVTLLIWMAIASLDATYVGIERISRGDDSESRVIGRPQGSAMRRRA